MATVLYSARTADGAERHGRLPASTLEEARATLEQRGLRDIVFHTDPLDATPPSVEPRDEELVQPTGPWEAVARSFASYFFLWAPLAALAWWSAGHGWIARALACALILAAIAYWLLLALPILAYERAQAAKAREDWAELTRMLWFLRLANRLVARSPTLAHAFEDDELRLWAATGRFDEAVARVSARPQPATPSEQAARHGLLLGLADYAHRHDEALAHARAAAAASPAVGAHWSELAMHEARFGSADAAYSALARAAPLERSALALTHERLALAWLAIREDDGTLALAQTSRVLADIETRKTPSTPGYRAFADVMHACALALSGRGREARRFFDVARRRLGPSSESDLVARARQLLAEPASNGGDAPRTP